MANTELKRTEYHTKDSFSLSCLPDCNTTMLTSLTVVNQYSWQCDLWREMLGFIISLSFFKLFGAASYPPLSSYTEESKQNYYLPSDNPFAYSPLALEIKANLKFESKMV